MAGQRRARPPYVQCRWVGVVRVTGEIDLCTAPQLLVAVNDALVDGARSIFIDLAQVSIFGAAGAMALPVARGTANAEVQS